MESISKVGSEKNMLVVNLWSTCSQIFKLFGTSIFWPYECYSRNLLCEQN